MTLAQFVMLLYSKVTTPFKLLNLESPIGSGTLNSDFGSAIIQTSNARFLIVSTEKGLSVASCNHGEKPEDECRRDEEWLIKALNT